MKKIIPFICLLFLYLNAFSQDIIILKTGDEIQSKVEEISESTVKYKKYENLTGPSYKIDVQKIFMIKYENGTKDLFNSKEVLPGITDRKENNNDFFEKKTFNNIELNKLFSGNKLVIGAGGLRCAAISYDGNYIGMYFVDALIKEFKYRLIKVNDNGYSEIELKGNKSPIEYFDNSIGFSKDSKQFYALTTNMELYIWSTETGNLLKKLSGKSRKDNNSAFVFVSNGSFSYDPGTDMVISDGFLFYSDELYIFNGNVTEPFASCATKIKIKGVPSHVVFSKDNQLMAFAGSFSKNADLYNLKTGQTAGNVNSCNKSVTAMQFTADNNNLLISEKLSMCSADIGNSTTVKLFTLDKYSYNMDVNCHNILAYSIIPNNNAGLWDLNTNKPLLDIAKPFKYTYKLLFSYDGSKLYGISAKGEIICWEINYN